MLVLCKGSPAPCSPPLAESLSFWGQPEATGYARKQDQLLKSMAELHFLSWSIRDCIKFESWLRVGWKRHFALRLFQSVGLPPERWVVAILYSQQDGSCVPYPPCAWALCGKSPRLFWCESICLQSCHLNRNWVFNQVYMAGTGGKKEKEKREGKRMGNRVTWWNLEPDRPRAGLLIYKLWELWVLYGPEPWFPICGMGGILSHGADVRIWWWSGCTVPGPRFLDFFKCFEGGGETAACCSISVLLAAQVALAST